MRFHIYLESSVTSIRLASAQTHIAVLVSQARFALFWFLAAPLCACFLASSVSGCVYSRVSRGQWESKGVFLEKETRSRLSTPIWRRKTQFGNRSDQDGGNWT